jgi:hypothetical protein
MTFIVGIIEALKWPIVIAFILWHNRNHLADLLERLENFEGLGAKAVFGKGLDKVEENYPDLPPLLPPPENNLPPKYLIQGSWTAVRNAIRNAAKEKGLDNGRNFRIANTVDLAKLLGLPKHQIFALRDLSHLRNVVVHGGETALNSITENDAQRYQNIAETLIKSIKNKQIGSEAL